MARPTKAELLQRFFPEIMEKRGTKGDQEAAMRVNSAACAAILADMLNLYDKGLAKYGQGALCLRLQNGAHESAYVSLEDFRWDQEMAAQAQEPQLETFLKDVIDHIERTNPEKAALLLLIDNSTAQLFPVTRDNPIQSIQDLMKEVAA